MTKKLSVSRTETAAVLLAVSVLLGGLPAQAQRRDTRPEFRHEFRIGLGGYPVGANLACGIFPIRRPDVSSYNPLGIRNDRYHDYRKGGISCGTLQLQYAYHFRRWFSIGANLGLDLLYGALYDGYTHERKGWQQAWGLSFYPEFRFTYLTKPVVRLYSGIGLGAGFYHNFNTEFSRMYNPETDTYQAEDPWSSVPILQFTPIGVSFGRKLFGFVDLQWGTLLVGGRAGIGYRF